MLVGALRGAGDTRFVLVNATIISFAAILTGRYLEQQFAWSETGYGLYGWWWVMTGWLFALGVTYLVRFEQGKWKSMRVIEPEVAEEVTAATNPAVGFGK